MPIPELLLFWKCAFAPADIINYGFIPEFVGRLPTVLEHAMLEITYAVPFIDGVQSCTITKEVILGTDDALISYKQQKQRA